MRIYKIIFALYLFSFCQAVTAQALQLDSLNQLLEAEIPDTNRVNALLDLAFHFHYLDGEKSLAYSYEALMLSEELDYDIGIFKAHYITAMASFGSSSAFEHAKLAVQYARKIQQDQLLFDSHHLLGQSFSHIRDFDRALIHFDSALLIAKDNNNLDQIAIISHRIGYTFSLDDNIDQAATFYRRAIEILEQKKDSINLALTYADFQSVLSDPKEKRYFILRAIEMAEAGTRLYPKMEGHLTFGKFLIQSVQQADSALTEFQKAYSIAQQIGDPYYQSLLLNNIGYTYAVLNSPDSAIFYLEQGLSLDSTNSTTQNRRDIFKNLSRVYSEQGNTQKAFEYLQETVILNDTIRDRERRELLTNAHARYDLSQKEAEIAEGELKIARQVSLQSRLIFGSLALLGLTIASFQFFFYRQRQRKQEVDIALQQERANAERLRELDELKTRFFTNVSHELRTPLTLISSPLEEALKELRQVQLEPQLQLAHRNTQRLLDLTNEILDLAKLEAGHLDLNQTTFFVLPQVSRILAAFESQAEIQEQTLLLNANIDDKLQLFTDLNKLEKIINNLIANAIKFTPPGGNISLHINSCPLPNSENQQQLVIQLKDSGQGIHTDDLGRVFDRFYQSKYNQSAQGGSGIGLALSKQLAGLLGGELKVESEWGIGSIFSLCLPLVTASQSLIGVAEKPVQQFKDNSLTRPTNTGPTPSPKTKISTARGSSGDARPPAFPTSSGKARLLIVEDNPDMAIYLQDSLKATYECQIAANGLEALQFLEEGSFDLVTSDVMMPMMDGFALRAAINEREEWQRIPFILITARSLEADKLRGFQLGIDDYVTKPFSLPELRARIGNLLRNKNHREQTWAGEKTGSAEEQLLQQAQAYVLERIDDTTLSVEELAKELGYSQRHLARVFGPLTGLSPVQFILEIRLQKARSLLEQKIYSSVAEVRYAIGIESASYFSRKFKERFGQSPGGVSA